MTADSRYISGRLERIVLVLVVCVPVPAFALSGLAIPLPSVVERAAAALVPWADATTLDTHELAASVTRGSIVAAADEAAAASFAAPETRDPRNVRPARRPVLTRTAVTGADRPTITPHVDAAVPETPRAPAAPTDPHADETFDTPAPAPADPAPSADTGGGSAPDLPNVTPVPAPAPLPDREPTDRADTKPADDTSITPATPPAEADPDTKPVEETPAETGPEPEKKPEKEKEKEKDEKDETPRDSEPGENRAIAADAGK
jgi:hypothetical protein